MKSIYLDYAAATPLDDDVRAAMLPYLEQDFYNPSSIYQPARQVRDAVDQARHKVAQVLGAKPTEIVFTSGGTESINAAILGVLQSLPDGHWVSSAIEHDAVLALQEPFSNMTRVDVRPNGVVDPAAIEEAITDQTVLVSLQLANNEIGTIQPVADVAKVIQRIRAGRRKLGIGRPLYLHTDAVQAANFLDLSVARLGVDLLSLSGSKIYGPKGSGVLYVRTGTAIRPLIWGGGQERGRRSGTENVAGAIGFAAALEKAAALRKAEGERLAKLRNDLWQNLKTIPDVILNGDPGKRLPNNLNMTLPGAEGQALVMYLDQAGFLVSTGSACSSGDLDPSHVLQAIGRSREEAADSLRITLGRASSAADMAKLANGLPAIVERVRSLK